MRTILDTGAVTATDSGRLDGELATSSVTVAELPFGVPIATEPHAQRE